MTAHKIEVPDMVGRPRTDVNEVRLVGRLAADPELRELPSGDTVWNLRVVVEPARRPRRAASAGRLARVRRLVRPAQEQVATGRPATWSR